MGATLQFSKTALYRSGKSAWISGFGGGPVRDRWAIPMFSPRDGPRLGASGDAMWGVGSMFSSDSVAPASIGTWGSGWNLRKPRQSPRSPSRRLTANRTGTWGFTGFGDQSRTPTRTRTWLDGLFPQNSFPGRASTPTRTWGLLRQDPHTWYPRGTATWGLPSYLQGPILNPVPPHGRSSTAYERGDWGCAK